MRITVKKGDAVIEIDDQLAGRSIATFPETIKQLITDMTKDLKEILNHGESQWGIETESEE